MGTASLCGREGGLPFAQSDFFLFFGCRPTSCEGDQKPPQGGLAAMSGRGMDEIKLPNRHYDAIVLGTSLPQCILASALSRAGKSVLHLDQKVKVLLRSTRHRDVFC